MDCSILRNWKAGKITSKEAMGLIGEELKTADDARKIELWDTSATILEAECPMPDVDPEADQRWWDENHIEDGE